jgi:hypothetical protein
LGTIAEAEFRAVIGPGDAGGFGAAFVPILEKTLQVLLKERFRRPAQMPLLARRGRLH